MTKRMLIDASHAEETRVAVVEGSRIEELDFEIASKKQLRGNIYLAKVIRVEPSLQAAFVEYGGNRHGFLAFNEIHPDYFQIPHADREALLRDANDDQDDELDPDDAERETRGGEDDEDDAIEQELERRRRRLMRKYKIQEVVRRRQIMLVQVVKEERGNKGAALTTYLSLAGRYCVLMPNTARGGGISRKITNAADRKRLKSAANGLDVPQGMGLIIRTAGAARTKAEIGRDYDYLLRMWENIRETTLKSIAPSLIYAEEDLVKRAVRDMFDKDFDSILVEGEVGWREAKDFMRLIMPSQAKKVILYADPTPLFVRHRVEDQIKEIHSSVVTLRSGGYLVINQTEALVAVDVNSGRATRERNIEQTALKTNTEAAEETARQLRLRDLAGLIVIDFIDMDESKNNRAVEKVLKDCLKDDRARVQMGKISAFGLMEISRQRRRMGVLEGSTHICEHCHGAGRVRSIESSAIAALRAIEVEAVKGGGGAIILRLPTAVGLYVLNSKRAYLAGLEQSHGLAVTVALDDALANAEQEIERTESLDDGRPLDLEPPKVSALLVHDPEDDDADEADDDDEDVELVSIDGADDSDVGTEALEARPPVARDEDGHGRRRRRGRGRSDVRETTSVDGFAGAEEPEGEADRDIDGLGGEAGATAGESESDRGKRRRRRGRRGGRRMREEGGESDVYGWSLSGASDESEAVDVYAWSDPHAPKSEGAVPTTLEAARPAPARTAAPTPLEDVASKPAPGPQVEAPPGADPYVWTDEADSTVATLAADDVASKPRRSRGGRGRGRSRGAERTPVEIDAVASDLTTSDPAFEAGDPSESEAPPAPEARVERTDETPTQPAETQPVDESAEPERADEDVAIVASERDAAHAAAAAPTPAPMVATPDLTPIEPDAEPEAAVETAPMIEPAPRVIASEPVVSPPKVDLAEIISPPATPKRGWWRRGG